MRSSRKLIGLIVLALLYASALSWLHRLTGSNVLDGSLGVLLGLYICSQPAANLVDLLFFERGVLYRVSKEWSGIGWLALNTLVLLIGCAVIVIGATRFVAVRMDVG